MARSRVPRAGRYLRAERGASGVEFALWLVFLIPVVLNVFDFGDFLYKTMQVRSAAQAGAETASTFCGYAGKTNSVEATCTNAYLNISNAVHSTPLGSQVTLASANEGYYCNLGVNNTSDNLWLASANTWSVNNGTPSSDPSDCSSVSNASDSTDTPGDYVAVTVNYTYNPLLKVPTILSLLRSTSTITQTAWMRVN